MNDKPKGRTIPKQRLAIENVELDVPYSQGTKFLDRVQAVNLSLADGDPLAGKPLRMTIFNQSVKTFVRGKTHIVADIEERDRPDSEYGPDRTIVQAYDEEGKPVSTKQGGGGGGYRRSLEDDLALEAVKRRSIEGQTSVAQVGAVLLSGIKLDEFPAGMVGLNPGDWQRIIAKYWRAVEKGLDNYLTEPAAPAPATRQAAQDKCQTASKPDKVSTDEGPPPDPIKHVGDLLTRANKLGYNPAQVGEILEMSPGMEIKDIGDLDAAWKKVQAAANARDGKTSEEAWSELGRK